MDTQRKVMEWLMSGDTGTSSEAMVSKFTETKNARVQRWGYHHPLDPSDLGRCIRMLAAIPEFKARLPEMKECSETWSNLVDRWDELCILYATDPAKCYDLIKECEVRPTKHQSTYRKIVGSDPEMSWRIATKIDDDDEIEG